MSVFMRGQKSLKQMVLDDWFSLTAQQIKKFHPEIDVECWCPERSYKKEKMFSNSGIKYRQFPTTFSLMYGLDLSIEMLKALKKEARKAEKDKIKLVMHIHEYHNLHGLMLATFFKNQKIIAQHHGGSWPWKHVRQTKRYKLFLPLFLLAQIWESLVIKNIRCFFALSQEEIDYLKRFAHNSRIKFQTMGIEDEYFEPMKKSIARKKLGLPLNKKIILFLGRINNVKGVRYLLDAMENLEDVGLKLIGWGDLDEFQSYAKEKKLKNVEFLGPIFGEKKLVYLSASDALVLPSSKEGAPVTVMEALARNLPVVASRVGGVALMIKNGENGLIIKPKSSEEIVKAVRKILTWENRDVRKYAERYRWKKIVEETVKEYAR